MHLRMYKAKLWDEDKWNIHSGSYSSSKYGSLASDSKKEDKKYNEQKYGAKEKGAGSDYMKKDEKEKDDKEKNQADVSEFDEFTRKPSHFDELVEEGKKEKEEMKEDEITFKAAKQIFNEARFESGKPEPKKEIKTIEEAIKSAIEDEKKVIVMDN